MSALTVKELLGMYDEYQLLLAEQKRAEKQLARAKLAHAPIDDIQARINELSSQLQLISDSMTFDTPRIWIEYKYRAYADEPQPITTMHDLRLHCSKPDYICTKRYTFLNAVLEKAGEAPLSDRTTYPDGMDIGTLLKSPLLDTLHDETIASWREYEYHSDADNHIAKWQSFDIS